MLQEAKHLFLSGLASEAGPVLMMGRALLCYRKAQKAWVQKQLLPRGPRASGGRRLRGMACFRCQASTSAMGCHGHAVATRITAELAGLPLRSANGFRGGATAPLPGTWRCMDDEVKTDDDGGFR
jgi:hypothetical protein